MTSSRTALLVSEVVRNLRSYATLSLGLVALTVVLGASVTLTSGAETAAIEAEYLALQERGVDVFSVRSESPFEVSQCDRLRAVVGIADAGSSLERTRASVAGLPGSSVAVARVTGGFVRIVWNTPTVAGAVGVGSEVSKALGLRNGQTVDLEPLVDHESRVLASIDMNLPPTQRMPGANQELVIVDLPQGQTGECLVLPERGATSSVERFLISTFNGATVSPLAKSDTALTGPDQRLHSRISLWIPIAAGSTILLLLAMVTFARRADWALSQLLGARSGDVLTMTVVESVVVVWTPFAIGSAIGLFIVGLSLPLGEMTLVTIAGDLLRVAALLLWGPLIAFGLVRRNPIDRLKGQ